MSEKKNKLLDLLTKVKVFGSMSEGNLNQIAGKFKQVEYKPGEYICREGETGHNMFIIASGKIEVLKKGERNKEIKVAELGEGDIAGVMSIFEDDTRSASLVAQDKVVLWELDKASFQELLAANPEIVHKILAELSSRFRQQTRFVAQLLSEEADDRLKIAFFDTKPYTQACFEARNKHNYSLHFFEPRLNSTTVSLASGFEVICPFVNDRLDTAVINQLADFGVKLIALRCAGYNNVDIKTAYEKGISVVRVPAYSPYAVAEHAVALMLSLNRKIHRAYNRVREGNFSLNGLIGFDFYNRTAGVIGVGKIGKCLVNILAGFGMKVLGYDPYPDKEFAEKTGLEYTDIDYILENSDVISLHVPLMPETHHMINQESISKMKDGVMLINTSRGGLVDTVALIDALREQKIGAAGLDVYEEEQAYFFEDLSSQVITDDHLARLMTFNNVIITSHQAFFTEEALNNIADTTFANIHEFAQGKQGQELTNNVLPKKN